MASRWIRSSDGHESTMGKDGDVVSVRIAAGSSKGHLADQQLKRGMTGRRIACRLRRRPLFNVADVVAVTVSSVGLPVRTPVDTRRFLVLLHGASLESAVTAPSMPSRAAIPLELREERRVSGRQAAGRGR
jgi:hypothetical protein